MQKNVRPDLFGSHDREYSKAREYPEDCNNSREREFADDRKTPREREYSDDRNNPRERGRPVRFGKGFIVASILSSLTLHALVAAHPTSAAALQSRQTKQSQSLQNPQIEVGPFELRKKYRSMEGPYVMRKIRIADLLSSHHLQFPASMVSYLDVPGGKAPSMMADSTETSSATPRGFKSSDKPTELLWFRGIKIQVLDENNKPLPTAEFICHTNIDVDQITRYMAFPELERTGNHRIMTLTQGQTEFYFPDGYAVPVSSDEEWKFTFQAANRTSNVPRKIKHLCTLSFVRDADLKVQPKALHWYNPYIAVKVDPLASVLPHFGPGCLMHSSGSNAPNMVPGSEYKDEHGQRLSPHWAVPPGLHHYQMPVSAEADDRDLAAEDRVIRAVWTHIHPACTNASLVDCNGDSHRKIFSVNAQTTFTPGPEIKHIDKILPKDGIILKAGPNYKFEATYDNPLQEQLDSMVVFGIFCESKKFVRPSWLQGQEPPPAVRPAKTSPADCDLYCGIRQKKDH